MNSNGKTLRGAWQRSAVLSATLFAAAAAQSVRAQASPPASTVIVDEVGRKVRVAQDVQRVVSLAPSLTETVFALGEEKKLVGDTVYCDYPEAAKQVTKVGDVLNPSLEQIVALKPDLVLVTRALNRLETVHALDQLNVPTYATDPRTVDDVLASTEKLAQILGNPEKGRALSAELAARLRELQKRLANSPPRRLLFVVWMDPLISIGQNTFIADALRRAGGVSLVESAQDWPQLSLEEAVRLQPDFLVFATGHADDAARQAEELAGRPGWRALEAVRNHRIAVISDAIDRPAPRIVSAIEELARQIHPEAFAEKDPPAKSFSLAPGSSEFRAAAAQREGCACDR